MEQLLKKYCRYCAFCISGDCYYCTCHDKELRRIDYQVKCKDFILSDLGDCETGRQYKPRKSRQMKADEQITFLKE